MVFPPFCHPAGQTSPCLSVNWKASTKRRVSSTDRPTGKSLMVICLIGNYYLALFCLLHTASSSLINDLPDNSLGVDDEQTTESYTSILQKNTIFASNLLGLVSNNRDIHFTETTLLARSVDPCKVRKF